MMVSAPFGRLRPLFAIRSAEKFVCFENGGFSCLPLGFAGLQKEADGSHSMVALNDRGRAQSNQGLATIQGLGYGRWALTTSLRTLSVKSFPVHITNHVQIKRTHTSHPRNSREEAVGPS